MGLFHFARRKRVPVPGAATQADTAPLDLQAFLLEPILTPSGLVDAPDHTPNVMDWMDHPGTDWHSSVPAALPDSSHVAMTPVHTTTDASAAHAATPGDHDVVLSGSGYGSTQAAATDQPITGGGYGDSATQASTTVTPALQAGDAHANTPVTTTPTAPTATTPTVLPAVDHTIASPASVSVVGSAVAPPLVTPAASQPLVGIIDTGFAAHNAHLDYSHITLGHDYVDGDNNPLLQPGRGNDHGTGMLGIVAATQNQGVEGMHSTTPIWLSRATGSGHWADALVEFVDHAKATGTPHAVVNFSFDLTQTNPDGSVSTRFAFTPPELAALQYAHTNHVLIVTAAGNQAGAMSALGQASQQFDNIMTVGAADGMGRAAYSSYGAGLDLLANGGTPEQPILTTMGNGMGAVAGSSAAAAQVTGAVSLVWQANSALSYRQVIDLLEHSATDVGTAGWDATTGFGVINLAAAIDLAKQTPLDVATAGTGTGVANLIPIPWATSDELVTGERPTDDWSETLPDLNSDNGSSGYVAADPTAPAVSNTDNASTSSDNSAAADSTPSDGTEGTEAGQDTAEQTTDTPSGSEMSGEDANSEATDDPPTNEPESDSTASEGDPASDADDNVPTDESEADSAESGSETTSDGTSGATTMEAPHNLSLFRFLGHLNEDGDVIPPDPNAPINSSTPLITGKAAPGLTIQLFEAEQGVGQATANDEGIWSITTTVLADGTHTLTAIATDPNGIVSPLSDPLIITIDTQPPTTPTIQLSPSSDSGRSNSDLQTNATTFRLSGTAAPGMTVEILHEGFRLGTATAAADGTWETTVTQEDGVLYQSLPEYGYPLTAATTDAAGNTSSSAPLPLVFYRATATPAIQGLATSNNGSLSQTEGSTQVSHPTIKGQADADTVVTLFSDEAGLVGQATANSRGVWQITTSNFEPGTHYLRAVATDVAGNVSGASHPFELTITLLDNVSGGGYGGEGDAGAGGGYGGTGYGGTGYGSGGNSSSSNPGTTTPNPADDPDNAFVDHAPTQPTDDPASDPGDDPADDPADDPTDNPTDNPTTPPTHTGATPDDYPPPTQESQDENTSDYLGSWDADYDFYENQPYGYRAQGRPTQPSYVAFNESVSYTFLPDVYWRAYYISYYRQDPPDPNDPHHVGNPPLGPATPAPSPDDPNQPPPLTYSEKLQGLLAQADSQLLGKRQAALAHYTGTLTALGNVVNTGQFYSFLSPVLGGVFATANFIQRRYEVKDDGYRLYWSLRQGDESITEQVYQAKLLAAVKLAQVPKLEEHLNDPAFITDLKALGSVYALIYATATAATAADESNRSFLAELWAAEDETGLQQGVTKLEQALQSASDPAKVLHFLRVLLEAAQQVPALKAQLHDAKLIDQLVQLGLNYAALETEPDSGQEPLWFCLDTLWNAQSPAEVRLGTKELTTFFQDLHSDDARLQALTLDNNLLKAVQQVPALQEQRKDPAFIKALLELGHRYAATQPGGQQPIDFFLDTLYRAKDDTAIALGAQELTTFLQGFDTDEQRLQLLQFEHKLIETADQVPALQEQEWLHDPTLTKTLVNLGRTYASVQPSDTPTPGASLNFFLDTVWRAQSKADLTQGAAELATFVKDVPDPIHELSFANSLIETAQQSLTFKDNLSHRIDVLGGLVRLGGAYAALDPKAEDVEHFFLNSLWQAQDANTVALAAPALDSWFESLPTATAQDPAQAQAQQVKLLGLERNLLQLVRQTPALQSLSQSPAFLQALTERGRTYAALYGATDATTTAFFFDQLWQQQDQGFAAAKPEFNQFVQALVDPNASMNSTQTFDPDALMFGLQLLLAAKGATLQANAAEGATTPAILPATFEALTVPLAHIAREYTTLNPDKQALTYDFFLNTLWQPDNTVSDQAQVQAGAKELAKFLGGGRFGTAFSPFEQADTLEFVAKTLKFVDLTPKLTEAQKQDPDILRRWVAMARAYGQLRPSDRSGAGDHFPDYDIIGLPPYFLETLWQTPLDSTTGIQDSIAQLDTLLTKLDIQDQLRWVELSAKFMKAWNYALEDVSADTVAVLSNPFVYLCFGGLAAALLGVQFWPGVDVVVDGVLSVLLLVLTAITGTSFLSNLLQFIIGLKQADVNDEPKLQEVGADLAHVLEDGANLAFTLFPQIPQSQALLKIVGRGIKVSDWLLNVEAANRGAVLKFLTKFDGNESVWQRFDSGTAGRQFLTEVAAYLGLEGKGKVLDLLAQDKSLNLLETLLGKTIDDAKGFIDELNGLLNFKNTTVEQLLELLGKATIEDLNSLLPGFADMTAGKLLELLGKASVEDLKALLPKMSVDTPAADLQGFLNKMSVAELKGFLEEMSPADLQGFLNKMSVADLEEFLAQMPPEILKDLLDTPGVTPEVLRDGLAQGLTPEAIRQTALEKLANAGYRPSAASAISEVARRNNVIIRTRQTNVDAPVLRDQGYSPKPPYVQTKTVNEYDTYIGASRENLGKTAYFEPTLDPATLDGLAPELRAKIEARFQERRMEYRDQADNIRNEINKGTIQVENNLVIDNIKGSPGRGKPFVGDIDTFDILDANGQPLSLSEAARIMDKLQMQVDDIVHGYHTDPAWGQGPQLGQSPAEAAAAETKFRIKQSILNRHTAGPGAEPLIEFRPDGSIGESFYGSDGQVRVLSN